MGVPRLIPRKPQQYFVRPCLDNFSCQIAPSDIQTAEKLVPLVRLGCLPKALPKELKPAIKDVLTAGFAAINNGEEPPEELAPPPPKVASKPPPPKPAAAKPKPAAAVKQPPPKTATAAEGEEDEEEGPADVCQFCAVQDPKLPLAFGNFGSGFHADDRRAAENYVYFSLFVLICA